MKITSEQREQIVALMRDAWAQGIEDLKKEILEALKHQVGSWVNLYLQKQGGDPGNGSGKALQALYGGEEDADEGSTSLQSDSGHLYRGS